MTGWLLRYPQHAGQSAQLADLFENSTLAELLKAVCQAAAENPQPEGFLDRVCRIAPQTANLAARLMMTELPKDFQPQRDIAACQKAVEKEALQRQLNAVRQQIKTAGAGQVPTQLLKKMTELQNRLKN